MPTDTKLQNLIINDLTEEQYNALTPNENELYLTPDTVINLYNHDIEITFNYDQNQASYIVYLNVVSSKNLNVNNITDLKTLLSNTFTRSCTSSNDNTSPQEVIAINNNGFIFNDYTNILFSEVTQMNIRDTVTTI